MTVYGLWERLYLESLIVGFGVCAVGWGWQMGGARGTAIYTVALIAGIVLSFLTWRARLTLSPHTIKYVGLFRSWERRVDEVVSLQELGTRMIINSGGGGFPVFRTKDDRLNRCPMVCFRTFERTDRMLLDIHDYYSRHGREIPIASLLIYGPLPDETPPSIESIREQYGKPPKRRDQ